MSMAKSSAACFTLLAAVLLAPQQVQAQGSGTVFSAGGQYEEEGAYTLNLGLDQAVGESTWLQLTAGMADASADALSLSTRRFGAGFDHFFAPVGVMLDVEYWGDSGTIETRSVAGELYFRAGQSRFGVNTAWRGIELEFEVPALVQNLVDESQDFTAIAFGASYRYSGERTSFYARATAWDYDEEIGDIATTADLSRVPVLLRSQVLQRLARVVNAVRFLSSSSLTLANSLLAHSATLGFDREFGERTLNIEIAHDRGEVDNLDVNSISAGWLWPVGEAVDLEARVGWSDADEYGSSGFGGLSLFVYR